MEMGKDDAESSHQLQVLINAVVDYAIYMIDMEGRILSWNSGAERLKGYTREEALGRNFSTFYTPEDRAAGLPERARQTAAAQGNFSAEGWRVRKDGTRFWASVVIDAIYDDNRNVVGFAKVTRDVTERYEAQKLLKEAQDKLVASQKLEAVGQLSGGIAHDFNNLLMIVLGNLETAQRYARQHPEATNLQRSLTNAMRGARRAAALTSRLLAFSRRQALDPKPLDVNRFITNAVEFLQRALGERVEIEAVGAAGLWRIEADANHLESALVNLAINARGAMPDGGKLTIEAANAFADSEYVRQNPEVTPGQYVVISVTDAGTGMTADVSGRAFEPFFTTKEAGQGTGLGVEPSPRLRQAVGRQREDLQRAGPRHDRAHVFPALHRARRKRRTAVGRPDCPRRSEQTILVVEDDEDVRGYLVETLRGLGYRVISASHGRVALEMLSNETRRIDLMLTDVVMPEINGRELARRATALRPGLRVLYMTGYSRNAIIPSGAASTKGSS